MTDVIHKQKFPGTKDTSSFLLNFIHPPQLALYELSTPRPFKAFVIRNQSENKTELCNKENQLAWTKGAIKTFFFNRGEYEINEHWPLHTIGK